MYLGHGVVSGVRCESFRVVALTEVERVTEAIP